MEWSEKEQHEIVTAALNGRDGVDAALRAGRRAVELAAARGGTMTAERMKVREALMAAKHAPGCEARRHLECHCYVREALEAFDAMMVTHGAHIAALEAERERLRNEMGAALVRAGMAESRVQELAIAGQELSAAVDKHVGEPAELATTPNDLWIRCSRCSAPTPHRWWPSPDAGPGWRCSVCSTLFVVKRYPCSPTCTHDDAASPGHPERMKERSEAVKSMTREQSALMGESIVQAREEAAEAMRAACWEAVERELVLLGLSKHVQARVKARVEGAAP